VILRHLRSDQGHIIRVDELEEVPAQKLLAPAAEHACHGRVHVGGHRVPVYDNALYGDIREQPVAGLALPQSALRPGALGDVLHDCEQEFAALRADELAREDPVADGAVPAAHAEFDS
jgi:hypothetical protein